MGVRRWSYLKLLTDSTFRISGQMVGAYLTMGGEVLLIFGAATTHTSWRPAAWGKTATSHTHTHTAVIVRCM